MTIYQKLISYWETNNFFFVKLAKKKDALSHFITQAMLQDKFSISIGITYSKVQYIQKFINAEWNSGCHSVLDH